MKATARTLTRTGLDHRIFWSLVAIMGIAVAVYIYGISMSIVNVVLREELEHQVAATHSRVATLEAEYLTKKEAIDLAKAEEAGFALLPHKEYVTRGSLTLRTGH